MSIVLALLLFAIDLFASGSLTLIFLFYIMCALLASGGYLSVLTALLPSNYLPILVFFFIALGFGVVTILAGYLVRPKNTYDQKLVPYESGILPETDARQQFPLRYYLIAMLFVLFDIEMVFMYPWAVSFSALGVFALIEMILFIAVLFVGYFYAWKKGALEWD